MDDLGGGVYNGRGAAQPKQRPLMVLLQLLKVVGKKQPGVHLKRAIMAILARLVPRSKLRSRADGRTFNRLFKYFLLSRVRAGVRVRMWCC